MTKELPRFMRYTLAGFIGMFGGVLLTDSIKSPRKEPNNAYVKDLNSDGINDIIVTNRYGDKFIYLGQQDSTYKRLDMVQKELGKSVLEKVVDFK